MADLPDGYFNLKHRLVGATVLILAAVILLPRVLTGTDVESAHPRVSARAAPQIKPKVLSVVSPSSLDSSEGLTKTRIEIIDQPAVGKAANDPESVHSTDRRSADDIDDRSVEFRLSTGSPVSESIVTGFIAQVGIFQRPKNARGLIANLRNDGIDAKEEIIEMDGREAVRVWLGPFSTRSEAIREGNKAMMRTHNRPIVKVWP